MRKGSLRSLTRLARSARRLSWRERRLACEALGWLILSRTCLAFVPYRILSSRAARLRPRHAPDATAEDCAAALRRAGRLLPLACLSRALAAQGLLARYGLAVDVQFGVRSGEDGRPVAHAWILSGGVPVTGAAEAAGCTPLTPTVVP